MAKRGVPARLDRRATVTQAAPRTDSRTWAEVGFASGILAVVAYGLASAVPMPSALEAVAASVFGVGIGLASAGLYEVLGLHRPRLSLKIALGANLAASVAVTMMLFAQIGFRRWLEVTFPTGVGAASGSPAYEAANGLQLGLDAAWDVFLAIGTVLFAANMWTHPRFGRAFALVGGSLAALLLVPNLVTFPEPPSEAGLFDPGPLVGLWYLAVAIRIGLSLRWVDDRAAEV
jgi:hypothetical protein